MKILSAQKTREADAWTVAHEPIADIDLMERAATACAQWLYEHIPGTRSVRVFAGTGNNGGDGLAIARLLAEKGYRVEVFLAGDPDKLSPNCRINYDRLPHPPGTLRENPSSGLFPKGEVGIIIDALFGTGLTRPVEGFPAEIIREINRSESLVISIDIPSGLFSDQSVRSIKDPAIVMADFTLTFSPPKLAFFFPENHQYTGEWVLLDIGISGEFISRAETSDFMVTRSDVKPLLHHRTKFAHKGMFGHALLICGGAGKMGAAVLAARGCLRSGAGLVTVRTPRSGVNILQTAVPEAMLAIDPHEQFYSELPVLENYTATGIGPGIGLEKCTQSAFKLLIQAGNPMVIDADALNILGENKTWLGFLPRGCILTPHPREFERIAGKSANDFERNQRQREFSFRHSCYIVLKGAYTAVTTPDGKCYFNTTGNPGMATGGSGDVLTGILTVLIAQHYLPLQACLLGTYLHGIAGDLAAEDTGQEALIAGDLVNYLGKAFHSVYGEL